MSEWLPPGGEQPYTGPPATGQPPQPYGYPVPGYPGHPGHPGHPVVGYPTGYPGMAGYPMGYPLAYPGYATDPRDVRPGVTMGAAVLAFINAGLLILAGGLLLLGASLVADVEDASNSHTNYGVEFALDGTANLIAGGLLIAGGVMITSRKPSGRAVLSVANGIVVALTIYWVVRFAGVELAGLLIYAILFGGLAVVSAVLSWLTPVSVWLTPRR